MRASLFAPLFASSFASRGASARRVARGPQPAALLGLSLALALLSPPLAAFELQRMDGTRTNVDAHVGDGRWTLVMLWTTDCIPCEAQKPMIGEFHDAHAASRAHVVGIALDGPAAMPEIETLVEHHAAPYPTLVAFDDVFDRQFAELVGKPFRATPTYLLYAPDGRFAGSHTGPIERERLEAVVASGG